MNPSKMCRLSRFPETQKVFERNISSWNENKSPQSKLCLGHDLSHQVKSKFIQNFLLCKGGCVFPILILPDFRMRELRVVQTQASLFLKSMSERGASVIQRL